MIKKIVTNKDILAKPSAHISNPEMLKVIIQDLKDTAMFHAGTKIGCAGSY